LNTLDLIFLCALRLLTAVLIVFLGGCTRTTYTDLPQQTMHAKIASGELVRSGERVTITLRAGEQRELTVSAITTDSVIGKEARWLERHESGFEEEAGVVFEEVTIPINDIVLSGTD